MFGNVQIEEGKMENIITIPHTQSIHHTKRLEIKYA